MRSLHWLALTLVVVGALNWGLVGLFDFDLVAALFGTDSGASRVIYTLVGISGLVLVATSSATRTYPAPTTAGPAI